MMEIIVKLPEKIYLRDTYIVKEEADSKGLKARLCRKWGAWLKRYRPLHFPINCEYCRHVGEAQWHCHNPESCRTGINVMPFDVCSKWTPNAGLMMYLRHRYWEQNAFDIK